MKIEKQKRKKHGLTVLETIVVIVIIVILASFIIPGRSVQRIRSSESKSINNQRQILLGCNTYAADYDGYFPSGAGDDDAKAKSGTGNAQYSQDAFNDLIPAYINVESVFWIKTNDPAKRLPPLEDENLEASESSYVYVTGQSTLNRSSSPLISDGEMNKQGEFNEYHPWLKNRKAIVGFVGGHVQEFRLTSNKPGATAGDFEGFEIKSIFKEHDSDIDNIFKKREDGGLLDTDPENILLPE